MNKKIIVARIEEIFKLAEVNSKDLYDAWKLWNESNGMDEKFYDALVEMVHPNGGIVAGNPLSYSSDINLWRACEVLRKMIQADEPITNWQFADFVLKSNQESFVFRSNYFRVPPSEKKSITRILLEKTG